MSQTEMKIVAVLGATGNQGGGVVRALVEKNDKAGSKFLIRAITRDANSPAAKKLESLYKDRGFFEVVSADIYNKESLVAAFQSAYGVFALTNNRAPNGLIETEDQLKHELVAGRNIIDAAKACNVQHFVMSSLPNIARASNGRFKHVYHFDYKNDIENWAKSELPAVTILHPGLYLTNFERPQYCRRRADGTVQFCFPLSPDTLSDWVDPTYDIGVYAAEILTVGPGKTSAKTYPVVSKKVPSIHFAQTFKQVTGKDAVFEPITIEEWGSIAAGVAGVGFKRDIEQMMEWNEVAPANRICYGTINPEDDDSWNDLGVKASTFEEWIQRNNWKGPQN